MKKNFLSILIFISSSFCFSQQKLDSIIPYIKKSKDSIIFDKAYDELSKLWVEENNDALLVYASKLLPISKHIEYDYGTARIYTIIGNVYNRIHEYANAFDNYNNAEIYYKKSKNKKGQAIINSNKSTLEDKMGNLESAIDYILQASLYFESINDTASLSYIYNNIGGIYHEYGDQNLTEKYYLQSIDLKRKIKSKKLAASLNNLASLYIDQKKVDSAKILLKEALGISKKDKDYTSIAFSYFQLGDISFSKKDYKKSKKYYDSSHVIAKKSKNKRIIVATNLQLGVIAMRTKDYIEAKELLMSAINQAKVTKITPLLLDGYKHAASLDSARGDFLSAFTWQKKYQKLADDNTSIENLKKIELSESRYKAEMKKLQSADEREKQELKDEQELFKYRVYAFISVGLSIIFFVLSVIIIKSRKERNKYIRELDESNQLKNKLFSIISHDLKNEIHGLDSSLTLLMNNTIPIEEFHEIIPLLANSTHQTSILLNNLLNWSKSQMKELRPTPTLFNTSDVINDKFSFFKSKAELKNVKLRNELGITMVFADKDMFAIISQNLIANAIKFCNAGDTIKLTSIEKEKYYEICFEDSGVGIPEEHLDKLFEEDTFTTNGTLNETGTGLGLRICKELIELNDGEINVHSILGKGSKFCITLPKVSLS